jgi:hypothetical protein
MVAGTDLRGAYEGPFVSVAGAATETGTVAIVIGPDNRLAGTVQNVTTAANGALAGDVDRGVALYATLAYPASSFTLRGNVAKDVDAHIVGALTQYDGTGRAVATFSVDLAPRPVPAE